MLSHSQKQCKKKEERKWCDTSGAPAWVILTLYTPLPHTHTHTHTHRYVVCYGGDDDDDDDGDGNR